MYFLKHFWGHFSWIIIKTLLKSFFFGIFPEFFQKFLQQFLQTMQWLRYCVSLFLETPPWKHWNRFSLFYYYFSNYHGRGILEGLPLMNECSENSSKDFLENFFFFECIPFPHRWSPGAPIKISLGIFSGIINFFARIVKKEDFWRFLLNDFSENCFRNSFTYPFRMHSHSCIWKFLQEFSRNSLRIFSINFHWLSFRRFGRIFSKDSFWN